MLRFLISWRSVLLVEETEEPGKTTDIPQARTYGHSMDLHPTVISLQGFYTRRDPKTTRPDFTPLTSEPGSASVYSLVF
jgi:hypothetical protein